LHGRITDLRGGVAASATGSHASVGSHCFIAVHDCADRADAGAAGAGADRAVAVIAGLPVHGAFLCKQLPVAASQESSLQKIHHHSFSAFQRSVIGADISRGAEMPSSHTVPSAAITRPPQFGIGVCTQSSRKPHRRNLSCRHPHHRILRRSATHTQLFTWSHSSIHCRHRVITNRTGADGPHEVEVGWEPANGPSSWVRVDAVTIPVSRHPVPRRISRIDPRAPVHQKMTAQTPRLPDVTTSMSLLPLQKKHVAAQCPAPTVKVTGLPEPQPGLPDRQSS